MPGSDDDYITHAREWWRTAKKQHPVATTIAEIAPVTGQIASVADYADHLEEGDTTGAISDAIGFIPGIKMLKRGTKLAPAAVRLAMTTAERVLNPVVKNSQKINNASNVSDLLDGVEEYAKEWHRVEE